MTVLHVLGTTVGGVIGGGAPVPPPSAAAVERQRAELRALGLLPSREEDGDSWAAGRRRAANPDAPIVAPVSLGKLTAPERQELAATFSATTGRPLTFKGPPPDRARQELEAMSPERRAAFEARLARLERRSERPVADADADADEDEGENEDPARDLVDGLLSTSRDARTSAVAEVLELEPGDREALVRALRTLSSGQRARALDAIASVVGHDSPTYRAIAWAVSSR